MLTEQEWATLRAVLDTLIPPDEDPSAWDAGVGEYLRRQFAGDLADRLDIYKQGLGRLDAEAEWRHSIPFTALTPDQRTALLHAIERKEVHTDWPIDPGSFVTMVANHCAEGYYADPGNGGNRDAISWRMIGFGPDDAPRDGAHVPSGTR